MEFNKNHKDEAHITIPYIADEDLVKNSVAKLFK